MHGPFAVFALQSSPFPPPAPLPLIRLCPVPCGSVKPSALLLRLRWLPGVGGSSRMHIAALTLGAAWAPPCTIQVVPYSRSDEVTCSRGGGRDGRVAESDTWWSAAGDPEFTAASLSAMPGPVTYLVDSCADSWGAFCPQIGRASRRAVGTTVSPARSSGGEPGVGFLTPRLSLPGLLCFFILWETLKPLVWSCRAAGNRNPGDTGPGRPRERPRPRLSSGPYCPLPATRRSVFS